MGTYKAEFLAHHYKGRLRPAAHYSMGWLPVAAPLAARAPGPGQRGRAGAGPGPGDQAGRAGCWPGPSGCCGPRRRRARGWYGMHLAELLVELLEIPA